MSRKPIKLTALALLLASSLAACGGNTTNNSTNKNSATNNSTSSSVNNSNSSVITATTSLIKSLTIKEGCENVEMKEGESILLTQYYTIEGNEKLNASQKLCTYVSSDPEVIEIDGKQAVAVGVGEATITITSREDTSKSCTFDIKVSGVFIDRDLSFMIEEDNFNNEWDETTGTGSIQTTSMQTNYYYIRGINSKNWYVETDITVNEVNNDRFPKIGIFASGYNSTNAETMVTFFLNADIGLNDTWDEERQEIVNGADNNTWNSFGVAEMAQNGQWAWNSGVTNSIARHTETAYVGTDTITYGTTFKLGVARNDMYFHVSVNGTYAFTYKISDDLTILYENGASINSHVGFFHFNSNVTFANYFKTEDATEINKHIPKTFTECEFYAD